MTVAVLAALLGGAAQAGAASRKATPRHAHRAAQPKKPTPPKKPAPPKDPSLARAQAAYAALQRYLYDPQTGLYTGSPYSFVWPFSQALAATETMTALPKVGGHYLPDFSDRVVNGLPRYWDQAKNPPGYDGMVVAPLGNGGIIGYDDNEWIGLALMRDYQRTHDPTLLARSEQLFQLAVSGWDTNPSHACPGGVVFSQDPRNVDRNTVTNAPGVELGLRIYQAAHDPYYLNWSQNFYNWVLGCMLGPNGLYEDHIDFTGNRDPTIWTYNQGSMIGANVLFYEVTGNRAYLQHARAGARGALAYFTHDQLETEPPYFVSIFFANLALLDSVAHDPTYRQAILWYGNWAWNHVRQPWNIFPFGTDGGEVLEQAAMVRIYALLAGSTG